jgi:hypothetical protein
MNWATSQGKLPPLTTLADVRLKLDNYITVLIGKKIILIFANSVTVVQHPFLITCARSVKLPDIARYKCPLLLLHVL